MTDAEQEYNDYLLKFSKEVKELRDDFNKMSLSNKTRFLAEMKPVVDAGALSWLLGQKQG
ncbi:MAG: hypothetical protein IKH09_09880 [Clostridia bacterium]|nr:hypothetical protein [Clostridia bacterium]